MRCMDDAAIHAILSGADRSLRARGLRCLTALGEPIYRSVVASRNARFDDGRRATVRLPRLTLSVGNLTTGGVGKTPLVAYLCQRLQQFGHRPAVLLRGYKAQPGQESDEAKLLAQVLGPSVPVQADPDRVRGAETVLMHRPAVDVFVLDDGFQHRRVRRDLDLVVIDCTQPFGYGHLLPRGLLREPIANLARADQVILTHADEVTTAQRWEVEALVQRHLGKPAVAHTAHQWSALRDAQGVDHPLTLLRDQPVAGLCAIGNPHAFARKLAQVCPHLVLLHALADHQHLPPALAQQLATAAREQGAAALVMTEKDYVKWPAGVDGLPIYRAVLALRWLQGEAGLTTMLRALPFGDYTARS